MHETIPRGKINLFNGLRFYHVSTKEINLGPIISSDNYKSRPHYEFFRNPPYPEFISNPKFNIDSKAEQIFEEVRTKIAPDLPSRKEAIFSF